MRPRGVASEQSWAGRKERLEQETLRGKDRAAE